MSRTHFGGYVTLAEALAVCHREYNDFVRHGTPEAKAAEGARIFQEHQTIAASEPYRMLVKTFGVSPENHQLIVLCIRFGMRVQKKLDSANGPQSDPSSEAEGGGNV